MAGDPQLHAGVLRHRHCAHARTEGVRQHRGVVRSARSAGLGRVQRLHHGRGVDQPAGRRQGPRPHHRAVCRGVVGRVRHRAAGAVAHRHPGLVAVRRQRRDHRGGRAAAARCRHWCGQLRPGARRRSADHVRARTAHRRCRGGIRPVRGDADGAAADLGRADRIERADGCRDPDGGVFRLDRAADADRLAVRPGFPNGGAAAVRRRWAAGRAAGGKRDAVAVGAVLPAVRVGRDRVGDLSGRAQHGRRPIPRHGTGHSERRHDHRLRAAARLSDPRWVAWRWNPQAPRGCCGCSPLYSPVCWRRRGSQEVSHRGRGSA